ncbi:hypothetical protein [Corynebacterium epidermidicanis]|uniref:Uncharacterized protein n=1 Tax=Corynebacterium epidermidicanis TaxID=1050174 RepID=A0A0G3GR77_9CORY|nr:hypothetical protein [Corynebacterium epidermidicanis]AKK02078.1 hypothetical protein CEPID_00920 [Corynebacterium epidermidicanis]
MTSSTPPRESDDDFVVGGQDRELTPQQQFDQINWYFQEHYPIVDLEDWLARLPDRLVHAAMMQLGSAVGHEWPGTEFTAGVSVQDHALGTLIAPSGVGGEPDVVASFGRPPGPATDNFYLPLVAAVAALSGKRILATTRVADARPLAEIGWGFGEGCPLIEDAGFDTVILTRPDQQYVATPAAYREEMQAVARLMKD